eukprot:RCo044398
MLPQNKLCTLDDGVFRGLHSLSAQEMHAQVLRDFLREIRHPLRQLPSLGFCPAQATHRVVTALRCVVRSWPLLQLRVRALLGGAVRIQRWFRHQRALLRGGLEQVLQLWVQTEEVQRKSLHEQVYKNIRLSKERAHLTAQSYVRAHKSQERMQAVLEALYRERRRKFIRQHHEWLAKVLQVEQRCRELEALPVEELRRRRATDG